MSKSIKLEDDIYIDSSCVYKGHYSINNYLLKNVEEHNVTASDLNDFLEQFKTFSGYKVHIGYATLNGTNCCFFGFYQSYGQGYGKVMVLTAWNNYLCALNNGTWTTYTLSVT